MTSTYFGMLPNFDFECIEKKDFDFLLSKDIYLKKTLSDGLEEEDDFFLKGCEKMRFPNIFIQNRKEYYIRKEIYYEMYLLDKDKVESGVQLPYHINEIEYEVNSEKYTHLKINILEKKLKVYRSKIYDEQLFLMYKNIDQYYDFTDFFELYRSDFEDDGDTSEIINFFKGKDSFHYPEIRKVWETMYLVREVWHYCLNKIKDIHKEDYDNLLANNRQAIIEQIFKDDGFKWFQCINTNYPGVKNPAYFSYLYFFLQESEKMLIFSSDNKIYTNYVSEIADLPTFSKVILTTTHNSPTKEKKENLFKDLIKTYLKND